MGCAQSKVDNEEAVARCKERKILMKEAVAARNTFAAGHSGYSMALKDTGAALNDYAHGEAEQPSEVILHSHHRVTPPVPPMIIESLPPPPPPLPNFSPSPIKRASSMPAIKLNKDGKGMGRGSAVIAEEGDENEDEVGEDEDIEDGDDIEVLDRLDRKDNRGKTSNASSQAPSLNPPTGENHLASPTIPDVKNMPWDYFYMPETMPEMPLGLEKRTDSQTSDSIGKRRVNEEEIHIGKRRGHEEEIHNVADVEPRTPERVLEAKTKDKEEEEEDMEAKRNEKGKAKQLEHSLSAQPEFAMMGGKPGTVSLMQVLAEIDDHFLKASECAAEVSKMLEATRLHYHSNFADNKGHIDHSARVMRVITWNKSFKDAGGGEVGKDELDFEDYETHATILDKLLAWEKKLYDEVKQGELMKLEYKKKVALLNKQKKRGSSVESMEKTKAAVSHLHTRYIVDMQSLDSTVSEVSHIRDKQLYPRLVSLVDGMAKMWADVCYNHESQLKIVTDLKGLEVSPDVKETSRHHHERTKQLHKVVQGWHSQFEKLATYQKQYVRCLNSWLKLNLIPIESSLKEKVASPPRAPSPPIQHLLLSWNDCLEKLPDELAKSAITSFAAVIKAIIDHQEEEMKLKEKCDETRREYVKKNQAFEEWNQKYMQKRIALDEGEDKGEEGNGKDPFADKQLTVESLKKRWEEELEAHQRHCLQVREKSLGSLKIRLPELFRALSDYSRSCSDEYEKLRSYVHLQQPDNCGS